MPIQLAWHFLLNLILNGSDAPSHSSTCRIWELSTVKTLCACMLLCGIYMYVYLYKSAKHWRVSERSTDHFRCLPTHASTSGHPHVTRYTGEPSLTAISPTISYSSIYLHKSVFCFVIQLSDDDRFLCLCWLYMSFYSKNVNINKITVILERCN